ncbi:hypothetical protein ACNAUF_24700, partial [Escherichia coli]
SPTGNAGIDYYSPRSHYADPVDFRGKGKGDVAPVEQTGTDTVSRTAFTAGDAAGAALLQS